MRNLPLWSFMITLLAVSGSAAAQDPPSRVARLNYMSGTVSFRPGTFDVWTAATVNYPLYNGDHLWADRDARTELHVGSTALRMGPETALAVLIPSMVYPLVSNWPPLAFAEAPFSVAKILLECPKLPPPPDDAPVCVPGD